MKATQSQLTAALSQLQKLDVTTTATTTAAAASNERYANYCLQFNFPVLLVHDIQSCFNEVANVFVRSRNGHRWCVCCICINCLACDDYNVFTNCGCNHIYSFDASENRHSDGVTTTAANQHKPQASSDIGTEMAALLYRAKAAAAEAEVLRLHTEAAQIEVANTF
jgi:hypothetical protein